MQNPSFVTINLITITLPVHGRTGSTSRSGPIFKTMEKSIDNYIGNSFLVLNGKIKFR
jgi:hypothetical protein